MRILSYFVSSLLIAYLLWGLLNSEAENGKQSIGTEPGGVVSPVQDFEAGNSPATTSSGPEPTSAPEPIFVESLREAEGYPPQSIGEDIDLDDVSVFEDAPVQSLGEDIDVDDFSIFDNAPQIDLGEDIDIEDVDISAFEIIQDVGEDVDPENFFGTDNDQPAQSLGEDLDPDTP